MAPDRSYVRCAIFLVLLACIFSICTPHFLSLSNLGNILSASSVIGVLALGSTFVVASGGIDLSVASVMAFSGTLCASVITFYPSISPMFALALCAVIGGLCGALTGTLINLTKAPSFIVTLGMLSIARAAAYIVADGTPIYGLPESIVAMGQERVFGLPGPVVMLSVIGLVTYVILHRTCFGAHILIFGDDSSAAIAMGIQPTRLQLRIYTLCGILAGISGFIFMSRTNAGDPTAGQNYELIAITAVVLGGTRLFGGQATIVGTFLGILCLGVLQNGLNLLAVSTYYQVLFVGVVLICAAFFERMGANK